MDINNLTEGLTLELTERHGDNDVLCIRDAQEQTWIEFFFAWGDSATWLHSVVTGTCTGLGLKPTDDAIIVTEDDDIRELTVREVIEIWAKQGT